MSERTQLIRQLTQGMGVLYSTKYGDSLQEELLTEEDIAVLVGTDDGWFHEISVNYVLKNALSLMPDSNEKAAISNALGYKVRKRTNLTQRREDFARSTGVSDRTVMRWEITGAEELLPFIDLHVRLTLQEVDGADGEPNSRGTSAEVQDLEERVLLLERLVARLMDDYQSRLPEDQRDTAVLDF